MSFRFMRRADCDYFRHLMKYNYRYRSRISWRLQVINYFNAFASLATGYRYFPYLEKWRLRAFDSIRRFDQEGHP